MKSKVQPAFTIVELLVVIVTIGVLAAITIVSYTGITTKAVSASLQSDIANAAQQLKIYQTSDPSGNYPTAINCSNPGVTEVCVKPSGSNSFTYQVDNTSGSQNYRLYATNGSSNYLTTSNTAAQPVSVVCPVGFIVVPGSSTYNTSDFCAMKYEAKNAGSNVPVSQAAGLPWVSINQTNAATYSANVAGCTGCHLITEAEWLTIAQNVLRVATNWSTGIVGPGYIYSGHNDNSPANALAASSDDTNGYYSTGQSSGNQRRTLTLSNGEVIWDLAGNVLEWTNGTSTNNQPGVTGSGYAWREWTAVTNPGSLAFNPSPSATGISGAGSWDSTKGIGMIYSSADETVSRSFFRGGNWGYGNIAGVLMMRAFYDATYTDPSLGFRVSR